MQGNKPGKGTNQVCISRNINIKLAGGSSEAKLMANRRQDAKRTHFHHAVDQLHYIVLE
jgi:hypothetical protein